MVSNSLLLKEKIALVNESRDRIHRSSTLLSGFLQQLNYEDKDKKRIIFNIKREIRTIIKELNKIGGFCDKSARELIESLSEAGSRFTIYGTVKGVRRVRPLIEYWVSKTNGLLLDYNKSPFKISAGFEINWDIFKAFLKGEYRR